jgi:ABC-type nitrate/sulfonate/bicarbonate transport system permease component
VFIVIRRVGGAKSYIIAVSLPRVFEADFIGVVTQANGMATGFLRLAVLGLLLAGWWVAADLLENRFLPGPTETFDAAGRLLLEGRLAEAVGQSSLVFSLGFAAAALTGVVTGVVMGAYRPLGRALDVFAYAFAATPRVAFIPMIIVLLGLGLEAKVVIVFLGAVMPILLSTYSGVAQADGELLEMAHSVRAGQWSVFTRILLPGALPFIVTGLRIGATIGLISTVVAELYTAVQGLGGLLALYGNTFRMAEYFVVVLTLALMGTIVTETLRLIETAVRNRT